MRREPYSHHIESIFDAIEVGLDGITDLAGNSFKEVTNVPPSRDSIDPDRFNRMSIRIDGEQYIVSVFRPSPSIECYTSTNGEHLFVGDQCIGCGATK